jgi:putative GTP pyrophosphokinase
MLCDFSTLLNRLSGMADEMSSYFRRMKEEKVNMEREKAREKE